MADLLIDLQLHSVQETGKELGRGAYGVVIEVIANGLPCAAKKVHPRLMQGRPEEKAYISESFARECRQHSRQRHPNIVQLLGVYFSRESELPLMVLELMAMSLSDCVEKNPGLPLPLKNQILIDVGLGLLHLHGQQPAIIHRDLTANNVLLTAHLTAKIADLGVARILNLAPGAMLTMAPGTRSHMPPEALTPNPDYNEKLDVFSFGNIMIHLFSERWILALPAFRQDPDSPRRKIPLSEIEKRSEYLALIGRDHSHLSLIHDCLEEFPEYRPPTVAVVDRLRELSCSFPSRLELLVERKQLMEAGNDVKSAVSVLKEEELMEKLRAKITDLQILRTDLLKKQEVIARLREENAQLKRDLQDSHSRRRTSSTHSPVVLERVVSREDYYDPFGSSDDDEELIRYVVRQQRRRACITDPGNSRAARHLSRSVHKHGQRNLDYSLTYKEPDHFHNQTGSGSGTPARTPSRIVDLVCFQLVVFGEVGVGKSSLISRNTLYESSHVPTAIDPETVGIRKTMVGERQVLMMVKEHKGDTETFSSHFSAFASSVDAVILVYDITNRRSFDEVWKWKNLIDSFLLSSPGMDNVPLALVGNKLDLRLEREVGISEAQDLAMAYEMIAAMEVSALTGQNIDGFFEHLAEVLVEKMTIESGAVRNKKSNGRKDNCVLQ